MQAKKIAIAIACLVNLSLYADTAIKTPADAFQAGKSFGQTGKSAAGGKVNSTTGQQALPNYSTNAPESGNFSGGHGNVGAAGNAKMANCKNSVSSNGLAQQECDAVNFLSKNPSTRPRFVIDKNKDPLITGSANTIKNPGTTPGDGTQQCHVETQTTPGTYKTESCEESLVTQSITCQKILIPDCAYTGSAITSSRTSKGGDFTTASITPTGTAGLYDYKLEVNIAASHYGGQGSAQLDFVLDTVGEGGYLTINLSNLDDATAIGVNGYAVIAGYPNAGPIYSGGYFPQNAQTFQIGYTWTEDIGSVCTAVDRDGKCTATRPNYQQFYASTKLLDFCPAGYAPISQDQFRYCDEFGSCSLPSSDTSVNVEGFFCNKQGKFLMNRHEGYGSWAGSVSTQMPLVQGNNTIAAYWGTTGIGRGGLTLTGQIYNVAPLCNSPWRDECAAARAASE